MDTTTDSESTLQEYQIQLEQVEIALKSKPDNEELLKLKDDLLEIIHLTKELIEEENASKPDAKRLSSGGSSSGASNTGASAGATESATWKTGDKCMAIWRVDSKYYSATVDQILEDGACTVIFDGYSSVELTQVGQLRARSKNATQLSNEFLVQNKANAGMSQIGHKKAFTKKELEQKLKEAKKRKKEKFALKLKAMEELSEKEKNKWKSFNTKLSSKTWKGVVKKNKFDLPSDHENKIGVGTNSLTNRAVSANGTILPSSTNSSAQATASALSSSSKAKSSQKHF